MGQKGSALSRMLNVTLTRAPAWLLRLNSRKNHVQKVVPRAKASQVLHNTTAEHLLERCLHLRTEMLLSGFVREAATFLINRRLSAWQCSVSPWLQAREVVSRAWIQSHFYSELQLFFCKVVHSWVSCLAHPVRL